MGYNMLADAQKYFTLKANNIPDWKNIDKNTLLNLYVKYEGKPEADYYLAAIILRYWHNIYRYYAKNNFFEKEEYLAWVIEGIMKAIRYRSWLDKNKSISKDPNGPDKTVNRCIMTVVGNYYYLNSADKRFANNNSVSIDTLVNENQTLEELFSAKVCHDNKLSYCTDLVQSYANKNKVLEAIIIDTICFQDTMKNNNLSMRKLIDNITSLNKNYIDYFANTYDIPKYKLEEVRKYIKSVSMPAKKSNTKLYKEVEILLATLRENKEIKKALCY